MAHLPGPDDIIDGDRPRCLWFDVSNAFYNLIINATWEIDQMNLQHLPHLRGRPDAGGFARRAGRLYLTQPALRANQALEAELGVALFDRIGRRIQLTSEGEDLLQRSRRLLRTLHRSGSVPARSKGGQMGDLGASALPRR
jgi:LysR family hydrogen peroxide-inducible transcriptional activator